MKHEKQLKNQPIGKLCQSNVLKSLLLKPKSNNLQEIIRLQDKV